MSSQDFIVAWQDISTHIIRESPIWPRWRVRIRKATSFLFFSGHGRAEPQTGTSSFMTIKGPHDDRLTLFVAHWGLVYEVLDGAMAPRRWHK